MCRVCNAEVETLDHVCNTAKGKIKSEYVKVVEDQGLEESEEK